MDKGMIEVPNLDTLDADELYECVVKFEKTVATFKLLKRYALHKKAAVEARSSGFIAAALTHEDKCEILYKMLPEEYRW